MEGTLDATTRGGVIEELRRRQLLAMDVAEVNNPRTGSRPMSFRSDVALAVWTRTVGTMLSVGIPLERAISFASRGAAEPLRSALENVLGGVRDGSPLAAAMRRESRIFGPVFVAMVSAGEETGALAAAMTELADHLDNSAEIRNQIRSALVYPALMAVVAATGITVMLLFVIPRFVEMLGDAGSALPWSTAILLGASNFLASYWWILGALVVIAFGGGRRLLSESRNAERWHRVRLRLPISGELERDRITARFLKVLGMLLRSGISLMPALRVAESSVVNLAIRNSIGVAINGVSQGRRLGDELEGILPALAVQMIGAGEESGRLDVFALRAADSYDRELNRRLKSTISLLEPALIIIFGLVVGFVALAMLQAIYSINPRIA